MRLREIVALIFGQTAMPSRFTFRRKAPFLRTKYSSARKKQLTSWSKSMDSSLTIPSVRSISSAGWTASRNTTRTSMSEAGDASLRACEPYKTPRTSRLPYSASNSRRSRLTITRTRSLIFQFYLLHAAKACPQLQFVLQDHARREDDLAEAGWAIEN